MNLFQSIDTFFNQEPRLLEWNALPIDSSLPHAQNLKDWLLDDMHGEMDFMERNLHMRLSPKEMEPWAKSIVIFSFGYPEALTELQDSSKPIVSSYAQGLDYHHEVRNLFLRLQEQLLQTHPQVELRSFVDSAPVYERDLALLGGLGWVGKNACIIHKKHGSAFFLGGFFCSEPLETEEKISQDFCGKCTRCIDACPTDAIVAPQKVDANKCISYLTIEKKGDIKPSLQPLLESHIFGCDICQQVCPWNHKHLIEKPAQQDSLEEWIALTRMGGGFKSKFKKTPLYRGGRKKLQRNLAIASQNTNRDDLQDLWAEILEEESQEQKDILNKIFTSSKI